MAPAVHSGARISGSRVTRYPWRSNGHLLGKRKRPGQMRYPTRVERRAVADSSLARLALERQGGGLLHQAGQGAQVFQEVAEGDFAMVTAQTETG